MRTALLATTGVSQRLQMMISSSPSRTGVAPREILGAAKLALLLLRHASLAPVAFASVLTDLKLEMEVSFRVTSNPY
jgi:hypothetical protein